MQDFLRYKKILQVMEKEYLQLPKGTLIYRTVDGHQYCHLQFRDATGVHNQRIKDDQIEQTKQTIQRRNELKKEIHALQQNLKKLEKTFPHLPTLFKALQTQDSQLTTSTNPYSKKPYRTAKGDYVRSKSELMIANELYINQIPYEYEKPLSLEGCRYDVYPDFTIYLPHQPQAIYWEHCGLMNDPSYRDRWEWKKQAYERNGICEWKKNLIITYESEAGDLNPDMIRQIIAGLLLHH